VERVIIHLDMDAFFAAVEQLDNPALRGKPVIVGGAPDERGVVSTCSYEARRFGVRSAMPLTEAARRCPQGIFVRGRGARYSEISKQLFSIMSCYSPCLERVSIDEAFLDVTHSQGLFGPGAEIAKTIQTRVATELSLPCSVGVAPNKFLAKVASDLKKPRGFVVVKSNEVHQFLAPLPVERIWGVGEKTAQGLHKMGLWTIGDLQNTTSAALERQFGIYGKRLWELAHGRDDRPVEEEEGVKSVGHEHTFDCDTADLELLKSTLLHLSSKVGRRLRKKMLRGNTVTLKFRFMDFSTFTRQAPLPSATDLDHDIYHAGVKLLEKIYDGRPVRLIGISTSHLVGVGEYTEQLNLLEKSPERARNLASTLDNIKTKHGEDIITYAKVKEFEK
jgi:DNA polymerase-4